MNKKKKETHNLWEEIQCFYKELVDKEEFQLTFSGADAGFLKAVSFNI